jgi:DNA-binding response OmpR family regulator
LARIQPFAIHEAADGQQALAQWHKHRPDLVILDGSMPKLDGFEVCRQIRHESDTPVILLTARGEEADVVRGLQVGADDYVTKPFSAKQLVARIEAVLRRARRDLVPPPAREVRAGELVLDLTAHQVTRAGRSVALTKMEFRLLELLAINEGKVVPYSRLLEQAWGYYDESNAALLKSHVTHIRRKLRLAAEGRGSIQAVVGVGYVLRRAAASRAPGAPQRTGHRRRRGERVTVPSDRRARAGRASGRATRAAAAGAVRCALARRAGPL